MTTTKKENKKQPSPKDHLVNQITALLQPLKEILTTGLGEKKLEKRIKKAAKLIVQGLKPVTAAKKSVKKPAAKKTTKKKSIPVPSKKLPALKKT